MQRTGALRRIGPIRCAAAAQHPRAFGGVKDAGLTGTDALFGVQQLDLGAARAGGAHKLGYKEVHTGRMAINSQPRDGRGACIQLGFCFQGCKSGAKWSTLYTEIPKAEATGNFELRPALRTLKTAAQVQQALGVQQTVVDARAPARYRGEVEPLDPVAGHIPGALNRPFATNIDTNGHFKPAAQLRAEFDALLAGRAPGTVVHQCGSGVSAIPNLLAMEVAGLGPTALFAGSWSEWCSDPARPVARG